MTDTVFDKGLQPERTLLAWRRTCLSFAIASLILTRYTADAFGAAGVLLGLAAAGLAVGAYVTSSVGYRRVHASLNRTGHTGRGGAPFLLATLAALAIGASAGVYLLVSLLRL